MMLSAIALLLALTWGGTRYPWISPPIVALIVAALLLSAAFIWWMLRVPEPLLPIAILTNPVMRAGSITSACSQGVTIGLTIFVPLYYELVHGMSASDSGLALIPIMAMVTPGSFMSSRAMLYTTHYKRVPIVLLILGALAVGALALDPLMPIWGVVVVMCLVGLGAGSSYPTVTVSIQNAVAHQQVGVAMGAMNFFRALASAFVVAVMGAIMLAGLGAAPQRGAATSAVVTAVVGGSAEQLVRTFSFIFAVAAGFLAIGVVALIVMEERPLRATVLTAPSGHETAAAGAE
jgi:hypothetical protein